jgi:hypothetical protein
MRFKSFDFWRGWLMVAVMSVIVVGPFFYGHAKAKIAPILHNKVLYADADMAKADWTTTVASIVGVLGIGIGWWWLDGAAALFISAGIVWDGWRNARSAVLDLMDQRARTHDDAAPHPLADRIVQLLRSQPWVAEASVRMRDMGQVFHVEAFVVPRRRRVRLARVEAARSQIADASAALTRQRDDGGPLRRPPTGCASGRRSGIDHRGQVDFACDRTDDGGFRVGVGLHMHLYVNFMRGFRACQETSPTTKFAMTKA